MIVLDTNVISELMRSRPHPAVRQWIAAQPRRTLFTTSANLAEILYGIRALPAGKRQTSLAETAQAMFDVDLAGHVLPFDAAAADRYSDIVISRRRSGKPIEVFDALIAAIAWVAAAPIATRDTGGFEECGLELIDPWQST